VCFVFLVKEYFRLDGAFGYIGGNRKEKKRQDKTRLANLMKLAGKE
jgi:hypothetical protein